MEPATSSQGPTFDVTPYVAKLRAVVPNSPPSEQLRDAVRLLSNRLEEVETQGTPPLHGCLELMTSTSPVTHILAEARRSSPPSTLLLTSRGLALATTPEVRTSLIRRCLRYISHGPWGSVWAEANGEREAFERIAQRLWPSAASDGETTTPDQRQTFTAGAGVVVTPVCILPEKNEDVAIRMRPAGRGELQGWILLREPHYHVQGGLPGTRGVVDITDQVMEAMRAGERVTVLYDHRFAVTFAPDLLPQTVGEELVKGTARVLIEPDTKWALPKVTLVGRTTQKCIGKYLWHIHGWNNTCKRPVEFQRWITMSFIRSLDAI